MSRPAPASLVTHALRMHTMQQQAAAPRSRGKKKMEKRHPKEGGSLGKGITGME